MLQPDPRFLMAYCERLGASAFWAEPLNAISNLGFLLAAVLVSLAWRRTGKRDVLHAGLAGVIGLIGIGSFLFHTVPNRITVLLDVLPIQVFILLYFGLALRRFLGLPIWTAFLGPALFFIASAGLVNALGNRALGGGIGYVPALFALFGFSLALAIRAQALPAEDAVLARYQACGLLIAGGVFALSLSLRTLDLPLCSAWPIGLHFIWHILNAVVLGVLGVIAGKRE